jgi:hypothetical protein
VSGIFDSVTSVFSVAGTFGGLTAPAIAAHVHGGVVGVAGPVIFPLAVTAATSGVVFGNSAPLTLAQANHLKNGDWYVNIHDGAFPGGEIRGQILLVSVPEPETYAAMAGVGLLGFAAWRRIKA